MSQHDLDIANQGFPATRADLNNALQALGSTNSGATAPSTTYANQLWYDTANNILKIRNEDNDAWISVLYLDQTNDAVTQFDVDNIRIDGNTISSTNTNGNITLDPNGTGGVVVAAGHKLGVNTTGPTLQTSINFDTSAIAGLGLHDTNSGNLGGMLQFYSGAGQGTLRANIMNANNAGVHMALGTSGSVVFSGTSYTAANALDDYEEGTWTATLEGSTTNPSSTVQITSARYTKVGRQVFVQGQFTNVDTTGASGAPRVTGLPFGASTSFATGNVMFYNRFTLGTTASNVSPYVAGSTIFFYQSTNQTGWAEVAHFAGAGAYLAFTAVYDV